MLSIIICSIDDEKFQRSAQMWTNLYPAGDMEIIHVKKARSLAYGYNVGIAQSKGQQLILVHDDVEVLNADFPQRLAAHFGRYDVIGVAGTTRLCGAVWNAAGPPHIFGQVVHAGDKGMILDAFCAAHRSMGGIQAMDGLFLAMHRRIPMALPFDDLTFDAFHLYDLDFTFRAYRAGFKLAVCSDLCLLHHSIGNFDDTWRVYAEKFLAKYAGQIPPTPPRKFAWTAMMVDDRREALEKMVWPTWGAQ